MKSNMDNDRLKLAKEALESGSYDKETIEYIFPELKESEDEKAIKEITNLVMQPSWKTESEFHRRKELVAWLEKQREKKSINNLTQQEAMDIAVAKCFEQGKQEPVEWSEEDKKMLEKVIDNIECPPCTTANYKPIREMVDWLKYLKYRVQSKQEWSEKDEDKLNRIYEILPKCIDCHPIECKELQDWLKSIRPQSQWKPSDEQMAALDSALRYSQVSHNSFKPLNSLFNDLKKLKG